MTNRARQVPSSDSEFAVAPEVKVQLTFIASVFVLILTVPLPENFPCSELRKAASSACAPVEQIRQAAASKAAVDLVKTSPLAIIGAIPGSEHGFPSGIASRQRERAIRRFRETVN
jgi:hypothetical protein